MKQLAGKWLLDIRFWIVFFFALRMVGITDPPLEPGHNWRQSLTCSIARNMVEQGPDLLHPKIDTDGDGPGILASEFPVFNYLIYLVSVVFGYDHWYGRLINLIVSSLGLWYFFKLLRDLFSSRLAFLSTLALTASIWLAYSRKTMPDTFSVSLVIMGLYHAVVFLRHKRWWSLCWFFVLTTIGILAKIPALTLFAGLFIILFIRTVPWSNKGLLIAAGTLSFSVVCGWYFYWVPQLEALYQNPLFFPKSLTEGWREFVPYWDLALHRFYFSAFKSFLAFGAFVVGLFFIARKGQLLVRLGMAGITVIFLVFAVKTGSTFPLHTYYMVAFVPLMAFVAGYFLDRLPKKWGYVLIGLMAIESIANQSHDFFPRASQQYKLSLEPLLDQHTTPNDLIIINGDKSPQLMYFAHRKGWSVHNDSLMQGGYITGLQQRGAQYLVVDRHLLEHDFVDYQKVHEGADFRIYNVGLK